jgi:DNA-directed RNA polymerase specialized sigma24 family protein
MASDYTPSPASLSKLLDWLTPDREQSATRYEEIRRKLIRFFTCRGCTEPENLADVTIDRVTRAIDQPSFQYVGDPTLYFYGVAKKVRLEHFRRQARVVEEPIVTDKSQDDRQRYDCLEHCLSTLTSGDHKLVLDYYSYEPGGKGSHRQLLADQLGIPLNALRIRLYRVRNRLRDCVKACMQQGLCT